MRFGRLQAVLVCLWLWCAGCAANEEVLELDQWSFEAPSGLAPVRVQLPANLSRELPSQRSQYWLRARVELPESMRDRTLTLAFSRFLAKSQLYANGHEAPLLDADSEAAYRAVGGQRFQIPREWNTGDVLELAMRVEHTWTRSAWLETVPRLSASRVGDNWTLFVMIWNQGTAMFSHAAVLVMFFFYAILFALDRRQVAFGWMALEAFAGSVYPAVNNGVSLLLFGGAEQLLLAMGLPISFWASVHFAHANFGLERPPRWLDVMLLGVLSITLAGNGRFSLTQIAGPPIVLSLAINVLYQMWLTARVWRAERSYRAVALFLSWAALGALAGPEMVSWLGYGELLNGLQFGCFGIMWIAILQSMVLGGDHIRYVRQAEELTHELANRVELLEQQNQEVARLNDELHRQIAARSEQLAQALARLAAGASAEPVELTEGAVVDERYRVVRAIGAGGMGRVYEVEREGDGMRLALKVLARPNGMAELARFSREAQIAAHLRHPNVVALVDVDVAPSGFLYLVMELVPGTSLREHDKRYGDLVWALGILRQIAEGLVAIHACGVVHRDLKPANVLLVGDSDTINPHAKITDFGVSSVGIPEQQRPRASRSGTDKKRETDTPSSSVTPEAPAPSTELDLSDLELTRQPARRTHSSVPAPRTSAPPPTGSLPSAVSTGSHSRSKPPLTASSSSGLTQTGMLIGTPRYMAPELTDGAHFTTPAVDIFSFGVIAYELLARTPPYPEPPAVVKLSDRPPPPLRQLGALRPELSPEVVQIIERCLSEDPEERPTAVEMADALALAIESLASDHHAAEEM